MTDQPHTDATEALARILALAEGVTPGTDPWHDSLAAHILAPENHRALLDALRDAGALVEDETRVWGGTYHFTRRVRLVEPEWREVTP